MSECLADTCVNAHELVNLRKQLEASQKLSEERRLALEEIGQYDQDEHCHYCGWHKFRNFHEPYCNYVRLTKKEE